VCVCVFPSLVSVNAINIHNSSALTFFCGQASDGILQEKNIGDMFFLSAHHQSSRRCRRFLRSSAAATPLPSLVEPAGVVALPLVALPLLLLLQGNSSTSGCTRLLQACWQKINDTCNVCTSTLRVRFTAPTATLESQRVQELLFLAMESSSSFVVGGEGFFNSMPCSVPTTSKDTVFLLLLLEISNN
jgi:hypothetical protein